MSPSFHVGRFSNQRIVKVGEVEVAVVSQTGRFNASVTVFTSAPEAAPIADLDGRRFPNLGEAEAEIRMTYDAAG